jgi:hypothetical protein
MGIKIIPRAIFNTAEEIELGKVVYYEPAFADGIAITADANGFATLNSVARFLKYDLARIQILANIVNEKNDAYSMPEIENRTLIFSPISKTLNDVQANMVKVMEHADIERISILNFTNYNLIAGEFPKDEIECVLRVMSSFEGKCLPHKIIFDIDGRNLYAFNQYLRGMDFS